LTANACRPDRAAQEEAPLDSPEFVYTTYIRTTPQRLWEALTDPAFSRRYLGQAIDVLQVDQRDQVVPDYAPYRSLAFTFRPAAAEPRSTVAFYLEPHGDQVKLTVVHGGLELNVPDAACRNEQA
jgi:uncharacterized protein YndB with AHSA1/START domain